MRRNLFWLSDEQWNRIEPHLPTDVRGVERADDRRVISGIVHVLKSGCRWCDCPPEYGPPTTIYNRFVRWARRGVWEDLFRELAGNGRATDTQMIDSTHVKAHRSAAGGKGGATTRSACGSAQSAMGPFYCPNDQKVYLDTSFFQDLERRFHACDIASKTCQFSEAYVIAHEVGHHVQNLLGILPKARQLQQGLDKVEANHVQVRVELQADCLAGVWAFHAEEKWRFMEPGDVESALKTASAIGDDRLQRQATGYVVPDAFTHGSAEQRTRWFTTGLKSGSLASCDTFSAAQL